MAGFKVLLHRLIQGLLNVQDLIEQFFAAYYDFSLRQRITVRSERMAEIVVEASSEDSSNRSNRQGGNLGPPSYKGARFSSDHSLAHVYQIVLSVVQRSVELTPFASIAE